MRMRWTIVVGLVALFACGARADDAATSAAHEIDAILARHWEAKHVQSNPPASDEVFVRRIYLDLAGRIPTAREAETYLSSADPHKRDALIDQLLVGEGYVYRFFQLWADALRLQSKSRTMGVLTGSAYADYVKDALRTNKPYDRWVREMITAKGRAWENGAIGFYVRDTGMPLDHAAITARVFLGTRIECAQCHNHPFDENWTQLKFYQTAAFTFGFGEGDYYRRIGLRDVFAQKNREAEAEAAAGSDKAARKAADEVVGKQIRTVVQVLNEMQGPFLGNNTDVSFKASALKLPHDYQYPDAKPFDVVKPQTSFGKTVTGDGDFASVEAYADWVASPDNPRFTTVVTNRLWRAVFGRALIEPLDDLKDASGGDVPELQAYLNRLMIERRYDMKAFVAAVVRTRAYQAQVTRREVHLGEPYDFTGPLLRRMTAEQVYDSFVTLIRPSPDQANPFAHEEAERAVAESKRADALFRAFPPGELWERALKTGKVLADQAAETKALQAKVDAARKAGDKAEAERLGKQAEQIVRHKWRTINDELVVPMLAHVLGRPVTPEQTGARNAIVETLRTARIPGIDEAPSPQKQAAAREAMESIFRQEAAYFGLPAGEFDKYADARLKQLKEWPRAADVESPAPRGHYLRDFGQSDRETVDNSNPEANIAQALLLMNSNLVPAATAKGSALAMTVRRSADEAGKVDAVCLAILSRRPTAAERQACGKARAGGLTIDDLAAALLNTRQFLFVQ